MTNPIRELASIYTEELALRARKCIVGRIWEKPELLPDSVREFKSLFTESLAFLRHEDCCSEDKREFLEAVFNAELRILLHQIVEIKRLAIDEAEDICQEILISLFRRLIPDTYGLDEMIERDKDEFRVQDDDYKSFILYCLKAIKNSGTRYQTKIKYSIEEYH
ncbi:MAG: hypothetical protein OEZ36_09770 [Spirochaetota bacterium]|nr:hypothetical protein [Spirochaetota bacterium]